MERLPNALAAVNATPLKGLRNSHTPGPWAWDESRNVLRPVKGDPYTSAVHTILSPDGPYTYLGRSWSDADAEVAMNYRLIENAPELLGELQRLRAVLNGAGYATDRTDAVIAKATGAGT